MESGSSIDLFPQEFARAYGQLLVGCVTGYAVFSRFRFSGKGVYEALLVEAQFFSPDRPAGNLTAARNTPTSDSRILKNQLKPRWPGRLTLVGIGTLLAATGLAAIHMGYWWMAHENTYVGTPGYPPTLACAFWGFILVVIGLIPWPKPRVSRKYQ
jgi:hypothetical protein